MFLTDELVYNASVFRVSAKGLRSHFWWRECKVSTKSNVQLQNFSNERTYTHRRIGVNIFIYLVIYFYLQMRLLLLVVVVVILLIIFSESSFYFFFI